MIALLQSFGLRFVANDGGMNANVTAPNIPQQAASASASAAPQTSPSGAGEAMDPDLEGWILVQGGRGSGSPRPFS